VTEVTEPTDVIALREHARALEDDVELAQQHGAQREEVFRLIVESIRDYAIFMLDAHGRVATWNIGAERIKGYAAHEIIGRHFSTFYPPETKGACDEELAIATRDGRFEDEGWRVRKDGSKFWANVVISAVRNDSGRLVGFSKVTRDLTERRRVEQERAARLAAEQANCAKDDFIAMLGHELRNPLAPIVTALQLMKLRNDGRLSREAQVIDRQVQHMQQLVDDLLDIARITRGKLELKRRAVDVRSVIASAIEIASPLIEQRQHRVDVDVPSRALVVNGDAARLTQVFANLLTNAAKYTDIGGQIWVEARRRGDEIVVSVRDDGNGIDGDFAPRVFDLFAQAYQGTDRSPGGLGIGLALVRQLTEMHGGSVAAYSAGLGYGSTFTVRLPAAQGDVEDRARGVAPLEAHARRRVLVVDDNDDARMLLAEALAGLGHDVQSAADGPSALELVKQFTPDIAILDIGLPGIDGYQLATELRDKLGTSPRFFALSGYGQPHDKERSAAAGFSKHFVKPVSLEELTSAFTS
jgi:PAS domain S-box-containing protein